MKDLKKYLNLLIVFGICTGASTQQYANSGIQETEHKAKTDSLENVISVVSKKEYTDPVKKQSEQLCDSIGYFKKGIAEGLKRCPVHKDKPCLPEPCPPHKPEILRYGYLNDKTLLEVILKCGVDCTEVIKIGVKDK